MVLQFHTVNDIFKAFSLTTVPACEQGKGELGSKAIEKVEIQQHTYYIYLSQRDVVEVPVIHGEAQFLAKGLNILEGVYPWAEYKEHWSGWPCLLKGDLKRDGSLLNILFTQLLFNIQPIYTE